jgi:hypothetical protein
MKLHLLATSLLTAGLLLSTLGCSKKEETAPAATGSYKIDGVLKTCQAQAVVNTVSGGLQPYNELKITLSTTPAPASGAEFMVLSFIKQQNQPPNSYQLQQLGYFTNGGSSGTLYNNDVTTLQESSGSYSGTFSGTSAPINSSTSPPHTLTAGEFSNVRP